MALDPETRDALHKLRDDMQTLQMSGVRRDQRLDTLEAAVRSYGEVTEATRVAMVEHNLICKQQKEKIDTLIELVETVKAGMRFSNYLRTGLIWIAGLATALLALWHQIRNN